MLSSSSHSHEKNVELDFLKRATSEAEAGPGASGFNETPENVVVPGEVDGQDASSSSADSQNHAVDKERPGTPPEQQRSKAQIAIIMSALGMAVFLAAMDVTIITTAVPTISEHFHSAAGYTWIGSAYLLGNSASTPIWGKISDIWGRKPILLIANFTFFVGSLIAALSVSIGMLIAARAIQGIGGGGLVVLVNICISDLFSLRSRGAYFGIIGGVWALASAIGPVIGGVFTQEVSWRWCFYINLPLDGAAFFIILFFLDLQTPKTPLWEGLKAIDWLGALTIVGGTLMFLFGLEFGGVSHPWNSPTVICLIVFGVFTIGLFVLNEWKLARYPIMPLRLFKYRSNIAALGVCWLHGFVFIASSYFLPLYFQAVLGASPLLSGAYLLPIAVALSISSAGTGIFIRKTGRYLPAIWFGLTFMTLGYGLLIDLPYPTHNSAKWAKIIIYQIVAGIGIGPNFQSPLIALQSLVHPRDIATATATFGFTRNLATSISVVIGGVVFQNQMKKHQGELRAALPPSTAAQLSGGSAGANVGLVDSLPAGPREVVRVAFAQSLKTDWIMYTAFSGLAVLVSLLITKQNLTKTHEQTRTGLEEEKRKTLARADSERRKRESGAPREEV